MKNVIEKIEKTLQDTERMYRHISEVHHGYLKSHYRGKMEAYMSILQSLKDYNLITAPKSIKLSELVKRLKNSFDCYTAECKLYREQNKIDIEYYYYSYVECLSSGYVVITNNKIKTIAADISTDIHKWLYELWIADTEIIDDLEVLKDVSDVL